MPKRKTKLSEKRYFTVAELAFELRLSEKTIRRQILTGKIYALQIGRSYRIPAAELLKLGVSVTVH